MKKLEDLLSFKGVPSTRELDWAAARSLVGGSLPTDYTKFVQQHGSGSIDDFLWILVPGCSNPNLDLVTVCPQMQEAVEEMRRMFGNDIPYSHESLVPWGITDNGDVCFWHTVGSEPDDWHVVAADTRMSDWEAHECGFESYLCGVLNRTIYSDAMGDEWLEANSTCHYYRYGQ